MKKICFTKTFLILTLIFSLCFNTAFAYNFSVDNKNNISESFNDENASFLKLLSKFGIYNFSYESDKILKCSEANDILKQLFMLDYNVISKDDVLTNEVLINGIVNSLGLKTSVKLNKIFTYSDFGFIDAKYRYSYEAYLNSFDILSPQLNPKDTVTLKDLIKILSVHEKYIVEKHGFKIIEGNVGEISLYNDIKTISLSNRNNVVIKRNDKLLFIGDEISKGCKAYLYTKDKKVFAIKCKTVEKSFESGAIYKGKVFLYDENTNKIIFNGIKKYSDFSFNNYINGFYEFDVFANFLVFDNYTSVDKDKINTDYLDKEAVFFTVIDKNQNEKICYIIYGGN